MYMYIYFIYILSIMSLLFVLPWRKTGFECCARVRLPYMGKIGFVHVFD